MTKKPKAKPDSSEAPVVTHHRVPVSGKPLAYTVTTGLVAFVSCAIVMPSSMMWMWPTPSRLGAPASSQAASAASQR